MNIQYVWVIESMNALPNYNGEKDVVYSVDWRLNGSVPGAGGTVSLNTNTLSSFTPHD